MSLADETYAEFNERMRFEISRAMGVPAPFTTAAPSVERDARRALEGFEREIGARLWRVEVPSEAESDRKITEHRMYFYSR